MKTINYENKTLKQLDDILDDWFSKFIRLRNADEYGMIRCITCGKRVHWKRADNGHFVKRGHAGTKYDEKNCGEQCRFPCNRRRNGEEQAHRIYIDKTYGEGTADMLKHKGKFPLTMTREEHIEKINHYKQIVTNNPLYKN